MDELVPSRLSQEWIGGATEVEAADQAAWREGAGTGHRVSIYRRCARAPRRSPSVARTVS
jgi:hypothetical protein